MKGLVVKRPEKLSRRDIENPVVLVVRQFEPSLPVDNRLEQRRRHFALVKLAQLGFLRPKLLAKLIVVLARLRQVLAEALEVAGTENLVALGVEEGRIENVSALGLQQRLILSE